MEWEFPVSSYKDTTLGNGGFELIGLNRAYSFLICFKNRGGSILIQN